MKINKNSTFVIEEEAFSGVKKIADKVRLDVQRVTGEMPQVAKHVENCQNVVLIGTVGKSPLLDKLNAEKIIDLKTIVGKNEVYLFNVISCADCKIDFLSGVKNILIIAGSDKRGTIYGAFHLSELMGVSPFVDWTNVLPLHQENIEISTKDNIVSKEPSVKYRGFFINDEWPAFGNWAMHHFGGVNAKLYEHVFELLLRLKGNYLWPAMWASRFSDDGPGLLNAELADELGVVMGASHHEPCCRAGEEYKHLRGKDSPYGDAWNFHTNREGITKFWEDGLKRNGKFENVITVGMRGEADTAILGRNATLSDNIELLRDVLKTQNSLIEKYVNSDINAVPRMLALYKEVEPYFYGDENTEGLMGSSELDGVTLMLCDDNHGNLRTVPTKKMQNHNGGYGMYYHLDYHGSPFSYEWINTSHLPKVKEQMTAAYDFGIRDLWVVNVGDIATTEFPLSYFLNLAYDYEKYSDLSYTAEDYTHDWVLQQFAGLSDDQKKRIEFVLNEYTKLAFMRRTECLYPHTFHPANYSESSRILSRAQAVLDQVIQLRKEITESKVKDILPGFYHNVYYPAFGTMNIIKMQILSGKNHWYAQKGIIDANQYAPKVKECLEADNNLVAENDTIDNGCWYAMGWSEHFGFTHWNEEQNMYPVYMTIEGTKKPRLIVWLEGSDITTSGLDWSKQQLYMLNFKNPNVESAVINISSGCKKPVPFFIRTSKDWLSFSTTEGTVSEQIAVTVTIDRDLLAKDTDKIAKIEIYNKDRSAGGVCVPILLDAATPTLIKNAPKNTFYQTGLHIAMEAAHYSNKTDGISCDDAMSGKSGITCSFKELKDYGKTLSAMKVFPVTSYFNKDLKQSPSLEYNFVLDRDVKCSIDFYLNPSNPATKDNFYMFGTSVNGVTQLKDIVSSKFAVGDAQEPWGTDVTNNIRICTLNFDCVKGLNTLKVFAITPCFVLEKIVIYPQKLLPPPSYLGPKETFFVE